MNKWEGYFPIPNSRNKERLVDLANLKNYTMISLLNKFLSNFNESELHKATYITHRLRFNQTENILVIIFDLTEDKSLYNSDLIKVTISENSYGLSRKIGNSISLITTNELESYENFIGTIKNLIH